MNLAERDTWCIQIFWKLKKKREDQRADVNVEGRILKIRQINWADLREIKRTWFSIFHVRDKSGSLSMNNLLDGDRMREKVEKYYRKSEKKFD